MNKERQNKNIIKEMGSAFYTSEPLFDLIIEKIFLNAWHPIGNVEQFLGNGYSPAIILDTVRPIPIIVSSHNTNLDELFILSNSCTHRGHIITDSCTQSKQLRCPYHGRKFNHLGKALSAPGFKNNIDFPSDNDHLEKLKNQQFSGLLFASISNTYSIFFKTIQALCSWYPLEKLSFNKALSRQYDIQCHWSLYVENYLEGLHVPFIHHGLSSAIDLSTYKTEVDSNSIVQYARSSNSSNTFSSLDGVPNNLKGCYGMYIYMFPNLMINLYSWGVSYNYVVPISPNKTIIKYFVLSFEKGLELDKEDSIEKVELEDQQAITKVDKGVRSPLYRHGQLSYNDEQGVIAFRKLLEKSIK